MNEPFALPAHGGALYWFAGNLAEIKIEAGADSPWAVCEVGGASGFSPPPHVHDRDDEAIYVLEGELSVLCGTIDRALGPGEFAFMPKGVPHHLTVTSPTPARWLLFQSPYGDFNSAVKDIGQPASRAALPPPAAPTDPTAMAIAVAKHHIRFLPPS
jgi:quercetin dioxygenase-like cupin family protein